MQFKFIVKSKTSFFKVKARLLFLSQSSGRSFASNYKFKFRFLFGFGKLVFIPKLGNFLKDAINN